MKHTKDRVIAIDYFRGICILMVLVNHAAVFSSPLYFLTGSGALWTSAAEMFLLLSGITLGIIRGSKIKSDFKAITQKIWRRAVLIYAINIMVVMASLILAANLTNSGMSIGNLPAGGATSLLGDILAFKYSIGWASFLMYYSVFLLLAPFVLYVLRTRFWPVIPLTSIFIFLLQAGGTPPTSIYSSFAIWQIYFILGLTIARFRLRIISLFYSLTPIFRNTVAKTIVTASLIITILGMLTGYNLFPIVNKLTVSGWLPVKLRSAYIHLLNHTPTIDILFKDGRLGVLRPLVALVTLAGVYLIYQKYKGIILARTGKFVNAMGRDTLWIFVAQAIAIPVISALPLPRNFFMNTVLTSLLISLMWLLTKRRSIIHALAVYTLELKTSYKSAKYAYIYGSQDSN